MRSRLSIGDFALVTRLTITTLRHYHRVGLLEPADVDPSTNYRYYTLDQVPTALTIRRYRQLRIPVEDVSALLAAADENERDRLLHEHLGRTDHGTMKDFVAEGMWWLPAKPKRRVPGTLRFRHRQWDGILGTHRIEA